MPPGARPATGPALTGDRLRSRPGSAGRCWPLLALVLILGGAALAATAGADQRQEAGIPGGRHDIALGQTLTRDDFRQQALAATNSSLFAPVPVSRLLQPGAGQEGADRAQAGLAAVRGHVRRPR